MTGLAERAAALLGGVVRSAAPLQGGDLSRIFRITLQDGRVAVVKNGPAPRTEASMLHAMAVAGAPTPAVFAVDDAALVMAQAATDGSIETAWHGLGTMLAKLHGATGTLYGWREDYAFGAVAIDNTPHPDWPIFWAERRLLTHASHVAPSIAHRLENLAGSLQDRLPAHPDAALLHGDLWGGNILVAHGRVTALIDPACYYGHAEIDLAMLCLFDHPGPAFFDAYGAPAPGHEDRRPIYQLWPALVHLRLFGQTYRGLVERLLTEAGA